MLMFQRFEAQRRFTAWANAAHLFKTPARDFIQRFRTMLGFGLFRSPGFAGGVSAAFLLPLAARADAPDLAAAGVAVTVVVAISAAALAAFAALAYALLPRAWPKPKRWVVALGLAPVGFAVLVLMLSGPGWLQQVIAHWLLPAASS